jgi:hypothetical protein
LNSIICLCDCQLLPIITILLFILDFTCKIKEKYGFVRKREKGRYKKKKERIIFRVYLFIVSLSVRLLLPRLHCSQFYLLFPLFSVTTKSEIQSSETVHANADCGLNHENL